MARPELLAVLRSAADSSEPDGVLLERFAAGHHAAFAELVRRYARLVWGQCRNLLNNEADADDAFQATFLTLAKSAKSIRDTDRLGPWLHGVAYKVCLNARRAAARRKKRERASTVAEAVRPVADSAWETAAAAVSEEVNLLPESLRLPFVLCHVEGKSPTDAAEQLGWRWGTFSSRLSRAKQRLLERLAARGVGAAVAVGLLGSGPSAPAAVVGRAAELGPNPASATASVVSLTAGVRAMSRVKLLAVVAMAAGVGLMFVPGGSQSPVPAATAAPVPQDETAKRKALEDAWADLASTDDLTASRALLTLRDRAGVAFLADKLKPLTLTEGRAKGLLADMGSNEEKTWKAAYEELSYLDPRLVLSVTDIAGESNGQVYDERLAAVLCNRPLAEADTFRWCKITLKVNPAPPKTGTPVPASILFTPHPDKPAQFKTILDRQGVPGGYSLAIASDVKSLDSVHTQHPSWRRAVRAVALLEHHGRPDAKKILDDMATGHPDAGPTRAAKEALERLKK